MFIFGFMVGAVVTAVGLFIAAAMKVSGEQSKEEEPFNVELQIAD